LWLRSLVKPRISTPSGPTKATVACGVDVSITKVRAPDMRAGWHGRSNSASPQKIGVAETLRLGLALAAVRGRGGPASEPRQALIGATVVCPGLPRIPWRHFLFQGVTA